MGFCFLNNVVVVVYILVYEKVVKFIGMFYMLVMFRVVIFEVEQVCSRLG